MKTSIISSKKAGGSAEVGAQISWGGPEGVECSGYIKGEIHDNEGNSAEIKVEQNDDGTGSATVSASYNDES